MAFLDVLNSYILNTNLLNNFYAVAILDIIGSVALSFLAGLFIRFVYQKTFKGVAYSSAFAVALMAMTSITTVLMMAVTSNMLLSLGMVGALSIVRFRTAIKTPMEIAFLFWAIETGIVIATGILPLGAIGNVAIGIFLLRSKWGSDRKTYMLLVRCANDEQYQEAMKITQLYANVEEKSVTPRRLRISDKKSVPAQDGNVAAPQGDSAPASVPAQDEYIEGIWEICFHKNLKIQADKTKEEAEEKEKKQEKQETQGQSVAIALLTELKRKGIEASLVSYNRSYMI